MRALSASSFRRPVDGRDGSSRLRTRAGEVRRQGQFSAREPQSGEWRPVWIDSAPAGRSRICARLPDGPNTQPVTTREATRAAGRYTDMTQAARISAAPQHLVALERANQVRLARAELKRKVAAGDISASEVILTCPWEAES